MVGGGMAAQRGGRAASRSVSPQLWGAGSSCTAGGPILGTRQAAWAKGEARKVREGGRGGAAETRARHGLAGWVSQAAGTGEIAVAVSGRGGGGVHRCPSQMRAVREAGAKSSDRNSGCPTKPDTCTGLSGERAAGGVLFFTIYHIPHTIPTLTHSSHPTRRIVAAFALPLS